MSFLNEVGAVQSFKSMFQCGFGSVDGPASLSNDPQRGRARNTQQVQYSSIHYTAVYMAGLCGVRGRCVGVDLVCVEGDAAVETLSWETVAGRHWIRSR